MTGRELIALCLLILVITMLFYIALGQLIR